MDTLGYKMANPMDILRANKQSRCAWATTFSATHLLEALRGAAILGAARHHHVPDGGLGWGLLRGEPLHAVLRGDELRVVKEVGERRAFLGHAVPAAPDQKLQNRLRLGGQPLERGALAGGHRERRLRARGGLHATLSESFTTDQSDAERASIFSRRTNRTRNARVYSHDGLIGRGTRGYILTTD
eukprot:1196323-Prorocentrum_minimum.AAC.3